MGKTYRGSGKDRLKDKYKQIREERQNKRHVSKDERNNNDKETDDRRMGNKYGSYGEDSF